MSVSGRKSSARLSGKVRAAAPSRGGTEAAPSSVEGLVFAGHPGGPPKAAPRRERVPLRAGLDSVENWMQAVITDPGGVGAGERSAEARRHIDRGAGTIEQVILPSRNQSSRERLQIYANAYFWRLVDILAEEYPVTRHVVGPKRFYRLAMDYLQVHPSRSYSLNGLSADFPGFVRASKGLSRSALASDIATVERTIDVVFDVADLKPLTTKQWKAVPITSWMARHIVMTPAMRLLNLDYPVNDFIAAIRQGRRAVPPRKGKQRLIIYRKDYTVWRAPLTPIRFTLLSELQAGKTLPEAFEMCASLKGFDEKVFTGALKKWFREWAADGLFCGLA